MILLRVDRHVTPLHKTLTFSWLPRSCSIILSLFIMLLLYLYQPPLLFLTCTPDVTLNQDEYTCSSVFLKHFSPDTCIGHLPCLLNIFQRLGFSMRCFLLLWFTLYKIKMLNILVYISFLICISPESLSFNIQHTHLLILCII